MTYNDFERCAVNVTVGMIAGKWKPVILQHLEPGEIRFVALWRAIPRVSKKVLLEQLRQLEADGLVGRREHQTFPPEVGYCLTERGTSLIPVLQFIDRWAAQHLPDRVVYRPHEVSE
ncbi:helix-turn-helix domain-containing protein [Hymenobacter sp.]|uniref:winged helix-turn-helix transcriptional regulator n=1 Tax=Hymenobacter sp. TaxID=1898978 RepID=UPI00286D0EC6|nr:helix-turn-helix domain-containing protein [Hymenobacter sp.]